MRTHYSDNGRTLCGIYVDPAHTVHQMAHNADRQVDCKRCRRLMAAQDDAIYGASRPKL